jgi:arsenate reductase-like glutaredoxin family protein
MSVLIRTLHITNVANPKKSRHWRQHNRTHMNEFEVMQRQVTKDRIRICNMEKEIDTYKNANARLKTFAKVNACKPETNTETIEELFNLIEELYGENAFESSEE